jgi:hypothetical protein
VPAAHPLELIRIVLCRPSGRRPRSANRFVSRRSVRHAIHRAYPFAIDRNSRWKGPSGGSDLRPVIISAWAL